MKCWKEDMAMANNIFIYPYKNGSKSVRALSESLNAKVIKREGSAFRDRRLKKTVINWGCSSIDNNNVLSCHQLLNYPSNVATWASNKLDAFVNIDGAIESDVVVPWTVDPGEVEDWLNDGHTVFARTLLTAHSGRGIVVLNPGDEIVDAPLYTRYVKKSSEFRFHIFHKEIIHTQKKVRKKDHENPNFLIRNLDNGFIYQSEGEINVPEAVTKMMTEEIIPNIPLDFYAADVIFNNHSNRGYLLELNSAPGITNGSTLRAYTEAFLKFI